MGKGCTLVTPQYIKSYIKTLAYNTNIVVLKDAYISTARITAAN